MRRRPDPLRLLLGGAASGPCLLLAALASLPRPAAAHDCGNTQISLVVGQELTGVQVVVADLRETTTSYVPNLLGDPLAVEVSPAAPFAERDAAFTFKATAPGQAVLAVEWAYAPTGASGTCYSIIDIRATGNQSPSSLLVAPADDLPIAVASLAGSQVLPVTGTVVDDGALRAVTINGASVSFRQTGTLTGGDLGTRRLFVFDGTPVVGGGAEGWVHVRVEDEAGVSLERIHTLSFTSTPSTATAGPPFGVLLSPPDQVTMRIPESPQPVRIPLQGTVADPDGNLLGVSVNLTPLGSLALVRYTDGTAMGGETELRGEDLFLQTHFALDATAGGPAPTTAFYRMQGAFEYASTASSETVPLRLRAWDAQGRSVEETRTLFVERSPGVQERAPTQVRFTSLVGTTIAVPDPTRPALLPLAGTLQDADGDLVDLTINGLPVPFSAGDGGVYRFSGTVILPPLAPAGNPKPCQEVRATAELVVRAMDLGGRRVEERRLVTLEGGGGPVTVVEERTGARPESFALGQNYPNPLNPSTTLRYRIPTGASVELVLYDAAGQRIRALVRSEQAAGDHQVEWDGRDEAGAPVASGTYFYQLSTGPHRAVRRLAVLR
ncbi:MAG: FlgD immunoglobulin-like domain containing protein [Candidatus Latescibacterota bacterium]